MVCNDSRKPWASSSFCCCHDNEKSWEEESTKKQTGQQLCIGKLISFESGRNQIKNNTRKSNHGNIKIDAEFRVLKCLWGCVSRQSTIRSDSQESYELCTFGWLWFCVRLPCIIQMSASTLTSFAKDPGSVLVIYSKGLTLPITSVPHVLERSGFHFPRYLHTCGAH